MQPTLLKIQRLQINGTRDECERIIRASGDCEYTFIRIWANYIRNN